MAQTPVEVVIETGRKRTFASALDWPGWSRSARAEKTVLDALLAYLPRYLPIVLESGLELPPEPQLHVLERLAGSATTDFGAPGAIAKTESKPYGADEARRAARLADACWQLLARVADGPRELRKGPRGGGRELKAIVAHVLEANTIYCRKLGLRPEPVQVDDPRAIEAARATTAELLSSAPRAPAGAWPLRYGIRRIAWHVLDHAWEIEDRRGLAADPSG